MAILIRYSHRGIDRPTASMVCIVHRVNGKVIKVAMPIQRAQAPFAHLGLDREKILIIKIKFGIKFGLIIFADGKYPINPCTGWRGACLNGEAWHKFSRCPKAKGGVVG
jgi:hypothetical protein